MAKGKKKSFDASEENVADVLDEVSEQQPSESVEPSVQPDHAPVVESVKKASKVVSKEKQENDLKAHAKFAKFKQEKK